MSIREVQSILKQLFSAYPNSQATEGTVAVYLRLLQDIPGDDLQAVIDQCIAECKFLPTVAEIRDRYHMLTRELGRPSSAEAWGNVLEQIRRTGYVGIPKFDDPLTEKVVKSMGWLELCRSDKPAVDRAQFMRMYDEWGKRDETKQRLLPQARDMAGKYIGMTKLGDLLQLPQKPEGEDVF